MDILSWQSLQWYNVWFYKTMKYRGLTNLQQHYPYMLINQLKHSEREENKRRDKRRDITTLGSGSSLSWWSGSSGGGHMLSSLLTLLLYPLGACRPSSAEDYCYACTVVLLPVLQKFSKWVGGQGWGGGGEGGSILVVSQSPSAELSFRLMQAFNFLACAASQRERVGFSKTASHLCRVLLACHGPVSSEEVCLWKYKVQCLICKFAWFEGVCLGFSRWMFVTIADSDLGLYPTPVRYLHKRIIKIYGFYMLVSQDISHVCTENKWKTWQMWYTKMVSHRQTTIDKDDCLPMLEDLF